MSGFKRAPRLRLAGALFLFLKAELRRPARYRPLALLAFLCLSHGAIAQGQHVVEPGDTLYALATRYGTTVDELRQENGLAGDLLRVGQLLELPSAVAGFRFEPARSGETLAQMAARLGLGQQSLELANPHLSGQLGEGASVRVPPADGVSLRLEEGESLLALAMRHGLAPSELLEANGLDHLGEPAPGDWIFLPLAAEAELPQVQGAPGVGGAATPGAGPAPFAASGVSPVEATPQWHARRQEELLLRAPELLTAFTPSSSVFVMPLEGRLSSGFGWRNISVAGNRFHGGIDLAVDSGTPVGAAMDGVVVRAGWVGAYGYAVYLDHGDGLQTRYAHLSQLLVVEGDVVRQGDTIARAGSTGASTGPHLHFEIRLEGQAVDPLSLLR